MRSVLPICLALLLAACDGRWSTLEVVDGDTLRLDGRTLQLRGVQAPEMNSLAACEQEMVLASAAYRHLYAYVQKGIRVEPVAVLGPTDGFLVDLYLADGTSVTAQLLESGLVVAWNGQKHDWCAPSS